MRTSRTLRRAPASSAPPSQQSRSRRSPKSKWRPAAACLLASLSRQVAAVRIPFSNCLADSYRFNDPPPLQYVPLYADAKFDAKDHRHNLEVIVWGNVTGSYNEADLPPADDPYWRNDNETNGKIVQTPNPNQHPKATTLEKKVNVLSYTPYQSATDFCANGIVNGTCPLGPVFSTVDSANPYILPSVNISHDFYSSYAFSSFTATFIVIYGDEAATDIGCASATITPDLGDIKWIPKYLPLLILLFTGFAVLFAATWSPWGTTDVFHWTSNYGRDVDLLRLVTPGFGDCLAYIQFIVLTGSLTLDYPGFFRPVVSQVSWSSLMFNHSFVSDSPSYQSLVDGIYITNGTYGLEEMGQLVGMAKPQDIWAGMMVWLCIVIAAVAICIQLGFLVQWSWRKASRIHQEDLVSKNIPFLLGNLVRIIYTYFLLPIVALSAFQLVIASRSPNYVVALAAVTLVVLIGFSAWLLYLIITTKPKSVLFDDLPTVLKYGPLYNTYSDDVASFALVPVILTFIRGIAIGAVQPSGIAQVVLLAICEVIEILTINAFRPFQSPTSMNVYHTVFSSIRLIVIMLMVAFSPSLGVTDGPKGWIGYVILLLHGIVLAFGFFLNALQTIVEVVARLLGAGGDDVRGLTRGGLSKIFGMRQLSRRVGPRSGPSRASQLSTTAMLDVEDGTKGGYAAPGGRVRSESAASMGGMAGAYRNRTSSAMDSIDLYGASGGLRNVDTTTSSMPGTPGQASTFSGMTSPADPRQSNAVPAEAQDPYYRPPRRRGNTQGESIILGSPVRRSTAHDTNRYSQVGEAAGDGPEPGSISRNATPAPVPGAAPLSLPPNRPDYATREVDFYYGVRGPALNSDGPGRKLGTGPADPTGPVATATGWFRNMFGGKSKDKSKGFEVVRSSRMPPGMMNRNGGFGDETPPEGIPLAMAGVRKGPIDSDDDDDAPRIRNFSSSHNQNTLLTNEGNPQSRLGSPVDEQAPQIGDIPGFPRSASKRRPSGFMDSSASHSGDEAAAAASGEESAHHQRAVDLSQTTQLPFNRQTSSRGRPSSTSSTLEFPEATLPSPGERPASFGTVSHHEVNKVEPPQDADLLESAAEVVDERSLRKHPSRTGTD